MTDSKGELVFVRMEMAVLLTDRKDKKMFVKKYAIVVLISKTYKLILSGHESRISLSFLPLPSLPPLCHSQAFCICMLMCFFAKVHYCDNVCNVC